MMMVDAATEQTAAAHRGESETLSRKLALFNDPMTYGQAAQ